MELLDLPRLESLTINMQKHSCDQFFWANFSPIIYQLRSNLPKLQITFNVSFDKVLKHSWDSPEWTSNGQNPKDYEPMGYVDVSELIEKPSQADVAYVDSHHVVKTTETKGRDAIRGLLAESHANRRHLGPYYVVKEPNLLRVLMQEHWEVYNQLKETESAFER